MAALPETFDHVPQVLWERAIISKIEDRDAASRKRHGRASGGGLHHQFRTRQGYPAIVQLSREYCKMGNSVKTICKMGPISCPIRGKDCKMGKFGHTAHKHALWSMGAETVRAPWQSGDCVAVHACASNATSLDV